MSTTGLDAPIVPPVICASCNTFLIVKNNRLWISILEVLIFRRIYKFKDLCLWNYPVTK